MDEHADEEIWEASTSSKDELGEVTMVIVNKKTGESQSLSTKTGASAEAAASETPSIDVESPGSEDPLGEKETPSIDIESLDSEDPLDEEEETAVMRRLWDEKPNGPDLVVDLSSDDDSDQESSSRSPAEEGADVGEQRQTDSDYNPDWGELSEEDASVSGQSLKS
jgi:hypothetical protein